MKPLVLALFCVVTSLSAQNYQTESSFTSSGFLSNDTSPFWFYTNEFGRNDPTTDVLVLGETSHQFKLTETSNLKVNAGLLYQNGTSGKTLQIDNAYLQYTNSWLNARIGSFHQDIELDGISSTNKNILWSGNTRAIPGILLEANAPIKIWDWLGLDWGIGHYELIDDRYVKGANIHYKHLGAHIKLSDKSKLHFEIQHFAQWAGTSPRFGKQPSKISDFIDVFFAKRSGSDDAPEGEVINALGNHLGSYNLSYNYTLDKGTLELYHQHLFEDGSGTALKNFPDGIWGAHLTFNNSILKAVNYEYIHTKNQNGFGTVSGNDNYFRNGIYDSGWTYENRTIGLPFIQPQSFYNPMGNSRVQGHHFGLLSSYKSFELQLKASYIESLGTYAQPFIPKRKALYTYAGLTYKTKNVGQFTIKTGLDILSYSGNLLGLAGSYKYTFN
ncbi:MULTISPECIES: capsule assembly Wzi family protein [Croceibacter]|uniref:capsule assembly Wzi family protein n=1 Tax=Croceibacter TaxID=216431 RepID=UPI000C68A616|nr:MULTISPECIES: capsule assembly Wzi family protein [Croceibacter]MBG26192.1 hypothetical protein [Croceibacter sp.]|tara:strand:- start:921 stop:2246 length:1326 start_codon:yes stop_codon:yes gene_type:complete